MKVLIIGGNGTIGSKVAEYFQSKYEVLIGSRTQGDVKIDISDTASIQAALEKTNNLDAIVCIAGEAKWDSFEKLTEDDYYVGIKSKLMGQINLVRIGYKYLNTNGSITLSTGVLADDPVEKTASAAMVNGAIHSFVKAVDIEIGQRIRVNAISLGVVEDAYEKYESYFAGHNPVPMKKVVNAYRKSIEGKIRGEVVRVYE